MDSLVAWFSSTLGQYISAEAVVFIISMLPIMECRGGLLAASLLKVPLLHAIPLAIIGNMVPIPFVLLFIKKLLRWLRRFKAFRPLVDKLEKRAMKKSSSVSGAEFTGLLVFVGIPLPGTGAWTGSLVASLLEMDVKKAFVSEFLGVLMATVIMAIVSYGLLGLIIR